VKWKLGDESTRDANLGNACLVSRHIHVQVRLDNSLDITLQMSTRRNRLNASPNRYFSKQQSQLVA
jgi:hypothetical protein